MDAEDLLARENEFKKLNKQLEKKTESLMKEIENVMQKQDIFSEFSKLTLSPRHRNPKKHCCSTPEPSNSTPERLCGSSHKYTKKIHQQKFSMPNNIKDGTEVNKIEYNNITNCLESNTTEYKTLSSAIEASKHFSKASKNGYNNITSHKHDDVTSCNNNRCNCEYDRRGNDFEFLYAFVSVNVKDNILPTSFMKDSNISVENLCKFLSSKVKLLQEQIDKLQATIDKKAKQCEKHMTHLAELESERLSFLNKANTMRAETADMKAKYAAIQNRLQEKDRLYKEQRSLTDKLTNELKQLKCKNASLEARCASQEESMTTLKQQLDIAKVSEKEFRDSTRTLSASHQSTIHGLETRVKALTLRADRQTALIENLKKQNALLQTDGAIKALEKEYCDFLKQDF